MAATDNFDQNLQVLSEEQQALAKSLAANGQAHLFANWAAPGTNDEDKKAMMDQLLTVNRAYPGGLESYYTTAQRLLKSSLEGANPFEGWEPSVPDGERLEFASERFEELEKRGRPELKRTGFVLVAGGLGERLGYKGIKVALPTEITTEMCYLEYYCQTILAFQRDANNDPNNRSKVTLPLAIMTSGDTHEATVALLEANGNFGMAEGQITLMKQEKVPALRNNDAEFATDGDYGIQLKPHGHGDVHVLMHTTGTAQKWADNGTRWVLFFQDTNGLVFKALPSALGVSSENGFCMNSVTVPRRPGQALGGIATLTKGDQVLTVNVEYNQLGPLLESTGDRKGDVADESGYSPYPGNCNIFILKADVYAQKLKESNGLMPEFVNPKYTDSTKTVFKKPTRIECMMQDYPRLLDPTQKSGMTQAARWYSMEPVKNNIKDAAVKLAKSGAAESGASGEASTYAVARKFLREAGAEIPEPTCREFAGIKVDYGARVVTTPKFAITLGDVKGHIKKGGKVKVSAESTLVLDGDIDLHNLELDGALIIKACVGAKVTIRNLTVKNDGWGFKDIDVDTSSEAQKYLIRGYVLDRRDQLELTFPVPGSYIVDDVGNINASVSAPACTEAAAAPRKRARVEGAEAAPEKMEVEP